MNEKPKILDVAALLEPHPERNLSRGQVGTIVEDLGGGVFEVEFSDNNGETIATIPVNEKDILLLHYETEQV